MYSRVAFWASTISACSTAARHLPTGGHLEQADGTAWMALFSQNMLEIAVELALTTPAMNMVFKFAEHFYFIASAMNKPGADGMWDEEDGFYYDLLRLPGWQCDTTQSALDGGTASLCAATTIVEE